MENGAIGIGRLDCYEDMFKEITRKLYGDDPDHRTSSVQNEFETSVSYKTEEDTGNATDSDDGQWTCEDEPLKGTDGSRIAAYHAGKSTWRCYECGDCMSGSPREVAEHFIELHSSRLIVEDLRNNRDHTTRKDYLQPDPKLEDLLLYLEKVRDRAERAAPPSRRTQETQTIPAALLPATTTFLLQELPSTPPQHLHASPTMMSSSSATTLTSSKRYTCPYCPYGTDRRDLYTRHENIHREEKPFHCYVCFKPFNRADHVKKHFLRMHREHTYELSRIRRNPSTTNDTKSLQPDGNQVNGVNQHTNYTTNYNNNKNYQLQASQSAPATSGVLYPSANVTSVVGNIPETNCATRRAQNTGCNSKSHVKTGAKSGVERRYTCCYCPWSGMDNWCLKRHLNTHLKPYACALCEYKAARAERLATHVLKVHNKRQCSRCNFLGEDVTQLQLHQQHVHRINSGAASVPTSTPTPDLQNPSAVNNTGSSPAGQVCNRPDTSVHSGASSRPPPGPPVFPTPAATILPSPTTILGASENRRSRPRKQSDPRKVIEQWDSEDEDDENKNNIVPLNSVTKELSNANCCTKALMTLYMLSQRSLKSPATRSSSSSLQNLGR